MWNPEVHSEDENVRWSYLRAIEWRRWPLFLSQTIGPLLLLRLPIITVIIGFCALNLMWALVRYRFVSPILASVGIFISIPKVLVWIGCAAFFFVHHDIIKALVSLLWLPIIFIIGAITPTKISLLQGQFMTALGLGEVRERQRSAEREIAVDTTV